MNKTITDLIRAMRQSEQIALQLHVVDELSTAEISAVMGWPVEDVERCLTKLLKGLQEALGAPLGLVNPMNYHNQGSR